MPLYHYQCLECQARDQRLAGLDDHTALCTGCGGMMLRLEEDIFAPYFEVGTEKFQVETSAKVSCGTAALGCPPLI